MAFIRLLTLNCWGLVRSRHKSVRFRHIAEHLTGGGLDIVTLQEVWYKEDYAELEKHLSSTFPYSHYFYSGVAGSGLCVFCVWPIEEIEFSEYLLSGPSIVPHVIGGDRLGGRGVALCVIRHPQHGVIHIFTTHVRKVLLLLLSLATCISNHSGHLDFVNITSSYHCEHMFSSCLLVDAVYVKVWFKTTR
jgi:endonuclease/exonuclease/phosphatase family metal-dependent hydrolase